MIPASSITATLSADLSYNPSIHVQTVEIDRTGTSLYAMATNNFVKWYITLKDFQNLCWNIRDLPNYSAASDNDQSNNIFAFARSGNHSYGADPYTITTFDATGAEYADTTADGVRVGTGVVLTNEASGGTVRFVQSSLTFNVPLYSDVPAYGNDISAGTESTVGASTVTYDRVMLDSDATTDIASSSANRTSASATTTSWSFVDTSFGMTVNWVASQAANETDFSNADFSYSNGPTGVTYAGMDHWGTNTIYVYASASSNISVTKPYNDAATDFIQIGMDASGSSSTFVSGVGTNTSGSGGLGLGTTTYGVAASDTGAGTLGSGNTDSGLVDPISANGMSTSTADNTSDSINFTSYFSDYTSTHNYNRRNLIEVTIGKPTVQVTETVFTKALQQAIDLDKVDVRDVSNTQSLRYAVNDAFIAGHLRGFQAGDVDNLSDPIAPRNGAISLDLPLTVAGQVRYTEADNITGQDAAASASSSTGSNHKKVYLTPIVELVSNNYYHPSWYTYTSNA